MESLCFYYHKHDLSNVNNFKYGLVDFTKLPEQPIPIKSFKKGEHIIEMYNLIKIAEQLKDKVIGNMIPSIDSINRNVEMLTKNISNIRNNSQQIINTIENVNITCPGITSDDVAKQIGTALMKEFSGMSLNAYQKMNVTR